MKKQKFSTWLALPLMTLLWAGAASAVSVIPGYTVDGGGSTTKVVTDYNDAGKIKYYIPLNGADNEPPMNYPGNYNGIYGVSGTSPCSNGAGTCSDYGRGSRYNGFQANPGDSLEMALQMNIFFDLTGVADSAAATLDFVFDDLDLQRINDPYGFFESLT